MKFLQKLIKNNAIDEGNENWIGHQIMRSHFFHNFRCLISSRRK